MPNNLNTAVLTRTGRLKRQTGSDFGLNCADQAKLAGWATVLTPRDHDTDQTVGRFYPSRNQADIVRDAHMAGLTSTSSGAPTELTGALNPETCRWLMGFPTGWARLPDTETR